MTNLPIAETQGTTIKTSTIGKIYGFEYLRAICCLSIVFLHTNVMSLLFDYRVVYNIMIYNIFYLVVPIFFQLALILFFLKREKQENYLTKRMPKLLQLYFFWGLISHLFYLFYHRGEYLTYLRKLDILEFLAFIIKDGYGNPFYFFFSLLFLTLLSELLVVCINKLDKFKIDGRLISYAGLILSGGIVVFLPLSVLWFGEDFLFLPQTEIPLNFIPYVFSSFLISKYISNTQEKSENASFYIPFFTTLILYLVCSWLEWHYLSNTLPWQSGRIDTLPMYSRISLVFGAWWITLLALKIKSEANWLFKSLSNVSLGIYALHTFTYIVLVYLFFNDTPPADAYAKIAVFSATVFSSLILTKLSQKIPFLKEYF